jgi:hypothetical protein
MAVVWSPGHIREKLAHILSLDDEERLQTGAYDAITLEEAQAMQAMLAEYADEIERRLATVVFVRSQGAQ